MSGNKDQDRKLICHLGALHSVLQMCDNQEGGSCRTDLWLLWEANEDNNKMICDVWASIQRDGHAGGGALVQGTMCQGAQKKPGQLTNVRHTLYEFFRPAEEKGRNLAKMMIYMATTDNT